MSSATPPNAFNKWVMFMRQRWNRWFSFDPEFKSYLPEHHREVRFPAPETIPETTPTGKYIRRFNIRYFDRDYRESKELGFNTEVIYRQDLIKNPPRIRRGQTVGPFYGYGMEKKTNVMFHQQEMRQVYSYIRPKQKYKPIQIEGREEEVKRIEADIRDQKKLESPNSSSSTKQ